MDFKINAFPANSFITLTCSAKNSGVSPFQNLPCSSPVDDAISGNCLQHHLRCRFQFVWTEQYSQKVRKVVQHTKLKIIFLYFTQITVLHGARGSAVGSGTVLQAGK
jgi:hypothetical protein